MLQHISLACILSVIRMHQSKMVEVGIMRYLLCNFAG